MKQTDIQNKFRKKFLNQGVKMTAPETVFFSNDTKIGKNVTIEPYVVFGSKVKIKDGNYKIGIRPHNITTYKEGNNSVEINGKVLISELSGSESLIHFTNGKLNWVSLSNGIQQKNIGENTKLFMNVDEFLYFDTNNRLVTNG